MKINTSVFLLSLALLADKLDVALGWVHNARYLGGQQPAGGSSRTPTPAVGTTPPVARQRRMLNFVATRARRSGRRFPSRLAGAAGAEPGKTFEAPVVEGAVAGPGAALNRNAGDPAVVSRDRVDQMKEWGAKGMWREAMEQLEEERKGGRRAVSGVATKETQFGCCRRARRKLYFPDTYVVHMNPELLSGKACTSISGKVLGPKRSYARGRFRFG